MNRHAMIEGRLKAAQELMRTGFFPPSPELEDAIMEAIRAGTVVQNPGEVSEEADNPAGLSLRGWVITGLIILVSLSTSFLSMNTADLAASRDVIFALSLGLTTGVILTVYGALFIGSHLEELSERFNLR